MGYVAGKRPLFDLVACCVIIATHFANYISYIGYSRIFPDLALSFAILFAIALILTGLLQVPSVILRTGIFSLLVIIFLSDAIFKFGTTEGGLWLNIKILSTFVVLALVFFLRENINKILIISFAAMFVSTLVLDLTESKNIVLDKVDPPSNLNGLPVVVHLVLDEHMGAGGMTHRLPGGVEIRKELEAFYLQNNFRLFNNAYSKFFDTHTSLASVLNSASGEAALGYATRSRNKYLLSTNQYFKNWAKRGYKINVLQSSYLDFCKIESVKTDACATYGHDAFDQAAISSLPLAERISLIGNMYFSSFTVFKLTQLAEKITRDSLGKFDISLPERGLWHGRVGPLAVSSPLERLIENVSRSNGGELFFSHLLIPHYPYVYNASCQVRSPITSWQMRASQEGSNSSETRRSRYIEYFAQIRCTMIKLQPLFDAMKQKGTFENAVIIIHGDHGSRITRIKPEAQNAASMTIDDYIDSYSTLFAFKAPNVASGTDNRVASLSQLIELTGNQTGAGLPTTNRPYVYLSSGGNKYVKTLLPVFPNSP